MINFPFSEPLNGWKLLEDCKKANTASVLKKIKNKV